MAAAPPGSPDPHLASLESWQGAPGVTAAEPRPPGPSVAVSSLCLAPNHGATASAKGVGSCSTCVPAFAKRGGGMEISVETPREGLQEDVASEDKNPQRLCNLAWCQ